MCAWWIRGDWIWSRFVSLALLQFSVNLFWILNFEFSVIHLSPSLYFLFLYNILSTHTCIKNKERKKDFAPWENLIPKLRRRRHRHEARWRKIKIKLLKNLLPKLLLKKLRPIIFHQFFLYLPSWHVPVFFLYTPFVMFLQQGGISVEHTIAPIWYVYTCILFSFAFQLLCKMWPTNLTDDTFSFSLIIFFFFNKISIFV